MRVYTTTKTISFRASRYWWRDQAYLTLTGQLVIDLPTEQSLSDKLLWEHTYPELVNIQPGMSFDQGRPKRKAEFLVAAYAYAYHENTTHCTVDINVGSLKKKLNVYGDRYWLKSGPLYNMSAPSAFTKIALSWSNAFGGKAWPLNPSGKGIDPNEQQRCPLANIEIPYETITNPHQRINPVGFLPLWTSVTQQKQLGTFDEPWVKKAWPYLPTDHNFHYWNGAPLDQQQATFWTGYEEISCTNMHPTKARQAYQLTGHKIRAFYQKKDQAAAEMLLDFDTIWVLPHLEQAVLIWHGTIPIVDETAFDIEAVLMAEENQQTGTLASSYYFSLLDAKINRKPPPIIAKEPKSATKRPLNPEVEKKMAAHKASVAAMQEKSAARKSAAQAKFDDMFAKQTPEQQARFNAAKSAPLGKPLYDPKLSSAENQRNIIAFMDQHADPKTKQLFQEARSKPIVLPDFTKMKQQLSEQLDKNPHKEQHTEHFSKILESITLGQTGHEKMQQRRVEFEEKSRNTPKTLDEKIAKALKEKIFKNMLICDHIFDGTLFDSIRFETTTFRNCQFNFCNFNHCTTSQLSFDQCIIKESHFKESQLNNFRWLKTTMALGSFQHCQLNTFQVTQSTFAQVPFDTCNFMLNHHLDTTWHACHFSQCHESNSYLKKITFTKGVWQNCLLQLIHYSQCDFQHSQFLQTQWATLNFIDTAVTNLYLEHTEGTHVSFEKCQLDNFSCKNVTIPALKITNSQLNHWQVLNSKLLRFSCQSTRLTNIELSHSDFSNSRYKDLIQVENCYLNNILLIKSAFTHTNFQYFQLSHCDISQSLWNRCTIHHSQWTANNALASRFFDCVFEHSFLTNSNFYKGSFKRSIFIDTSITDCNLVRVNFYHASANHMTMKGCLLPNPLPIGFWEQWRKIDHD